MNFSLIRSTKYIAAILLMVLAMSCATKKHKEDLGAMGKLYHYTTSRFNGYFNANELVKESMILLASAKEDNYTKILNVYDYSAAPDPSIVSEDLDNAIKKVSVVVNLHRGKSVWEDDCYLLMGKAQYLKREYESAEETLEFLTAEFSPEMMAEKEAKSKKRKKSNKAKKKTDKKKKTSAKKRTKEREKARKKKKRERQKSVEEEKKGKGIQIEQ